VIAVANAPCSWGVLEFEAPAAAPPSQVLDEIAATGYAGTELGDWGFFPTAPDALAAEIGRRRLALVGAFVPVALARAEAIAEGTERAVRTARLLRDADAAVKGCATTFNDGVTGANVAQPFSAATAAPPFRPAAPFVVLSDENAAVPLRTQRAGRIRPEDGLSAVDWDGFAARAEHIARAVAEHTGLRTVFHHHCGGYVETPSEIDALMSRTAPDVLGLCLDTGHLTFAGGDPLAALRQYGDRIRHVHFKDCDPRVARAAREEEWDYHTAVRRGIFCELGRGSVPFPAVRDALRTTDYDGWIVVEQDVLPGLGTPAESARRNREYLRGIGL
jgi:inosose dehydratase